MKWKQVLKSFAWRFIVCLVVFGGLYALIFGFGAKKQELTPKQQLGQLRGAIDQVYLGSANLNKFKPQGLNSVNDLLTSISQYKSGSESLKTGLKAATKLTPELRNSIAKLSTAATKATTGYDTRFAVYQKVLVYDPETDLHAIDLTKDTAEAQSRAGGAAGGLANAATKAKAAALLPDNLGQLLAQESSCFAKLSDQLQSHSITEAIATRNICINDYDALRIAIMDELFTPFRGEYQTQIKNAPELIKQLDSLIAKT
jgi:uncharacterized phage infection (PIP) family protein YhgE